MDVLITGTAVTLAVLVIPLIVVTRGIRRQERAGLASVNAGPCAALTRRVLGLRATPEPLPGQVLAARTRP